MKNLSLSFLAQRLDNQDPTHMELNQCPLAEGNVAERQELARQISEVSLGGYQVFSEGSHTAFLLDDKFLLETPPDQLDDAGRITPIVCYGRVPESPPVSWSGDVVKAVVGFAERIGRTISPKNQEIAGRGVDAILEEAQKKSRIRAMVGMISIESGFTRALRPTRVLWVVGGLVIALTVLGVSYKILFKE